MVTGVHGVGRTAQEGKFGSSLNVFCSFSFLFHSPVLEPGLNLQREISKTISLRFTMACIVHRFDRLMIKQILKK